MTDRTDVEWLSRSASPADWRRGSSGRTAQHRPQLPARGVGPEAVAHAVAEPEVVVRLSPDVERARALEDRLVTIVGPVEDADGVAGANPSALELDVGSRGARELDDLAGR